MKRIFFLIITALLTQYSVFAQITEQVIEVADNDCTLNGTLTMPESLATTVVTLIVAGSGPTDRDGNQSMMRSNSYKMLAHNLAAKGIASVRYDKRGLGASRYLKFDQQNVRLSTYADDVALWVKALRADNRFSKVVVIGHSEGSMLALMAADNGAKIAGIVSLAGVGRTIDQVLKDQLSSQPLQIRNAAYEIIDTLKKGHIYKNVPVFLVSVFNPAVQPFLISMIKANPQELIRNLTMPILIVQGDTDIQVRIEDARLLSAANHNAELAIIVGMNHVLKLCPTRDRDMQMATYSNPAIPLHGGLTAPIVNFIKSL